MHHLRRLTTAVPTLALVAALSAIPLPAQQRVTVGGLRLTVPAEWKATADRNGSTQIVPAVGAADFVVILTAGQAPGADSAGVHDSLLARLSVTKRGSRALIVSRDGTRFRSTNAEFDASGKSVRGALATSHAGRDWVAIAALTDSRLRWFLLEPEFRKMIETAETIAAPASGESAVAAQAPPPSAGSISRPSEQRPSDVPPSMTGPDLTAPHDNVFGDGTGVAGVYVGVGRGFKLGAAGMEIGTVDRTLVLFRDGSSTSIIPSEGFDPVDLPWFKAQYPDRFQRWTQRGTHITIEDGPRTATYRVKDGILFDNDDPSSTAFTRVATRPGMTMQGTYALYHWKPADFADPKYFPYGMMHITFAADGTFEDVGQINTIYMGPSRLPFRGQAFFERLKTPAKGRYRIVNNSLYLTYSDGRELALAFWVQAGAGTGPSPSAIVVNRYVLTLRR